MAQGPNGWVALGPNGHSKGPPQYRGSSESAMGESQWAKSCSNLRSPTEQCSPSAPQDRGGSTSEVGEREAAKEGCINRPTLVKRSEEPLSLRAPGSIPRERIGESSFPFFETLEQPLLHLVKTEKRSPRSQPVAGRIRRTNSSRPGDCWSRRTLRAHHWL